MLYHFLLTFPLSFTGVLTTYLYIILLIFSEWCWRSFDITCRISNFPPIEVSKWDTKDTVICKSHLLFFKLVYGFPFPKGYSYKFKLSNNNTHTHTHVCVYVYVVSFSPHFFHWVQEFKWYIGIFLRFFSQGFSKKFSYIV